MGFARLVLSESREYDPTLIGLSVAVGVLQKKQIGSGADEQAAIPTRNGGRVIQLVGENRTPVVSSVAVGVFEHADTTGVLKSLHHIRVVLWQLNDIHAAILVEIDRDRITNQRLGGGQFDVESVADLNLL